MVRSMARGDPAALVALLSRTNPRFARFAEQNRGKTPEQMFRDAGVDFSRVRRMM